MLVVFDCEIEKAIPTRGPRQKKIQYCGGHKDFKNMGIACIAAMESETKRPRVFLKDNLEEFEQLVNKADILAGFNSMAFDNPLCLANGIYIPEEKSYDLLLEIWTAAGLGPKFEYETHMGYSLDACVKANGPSPLGKTGSGSQAPILWQKGKPGTVIDYCLNDVWLLWFLLELVFTFEVLIDPVTGNDLRIRKPEPYGGENGIPQTI